MFYKDLEKRKEKIRQYIRENPKATYKDLRKIGIKVDRVYKGKMADAFRDAGVTPPRTFQIKSRDEKKRILIEYVRKNPSVGGHIIKRDTKINFLSLFKNTKELFDAAGIVYPRKVDRRSREEKIKEIISLIKTDPLLNVEQIMKKLHINFYKFFKNFDEAYKEAKLNNIMGHEKRRLRKIDKVLQFIKSNPMATQREINLACNTHVQLLFKDGIFEAYKKAKLKYPFQRLILYGTATKRIKNRAKEFENKIAIKLSKYGKVSRLVKTKRGYADIILERNNKKSIIEVKDYESKDISISQIKQLNKYLEDCGCNLGILICYKKPKRDRFLIGKNSIFVLNYAELNKIPTLIDKGAW